MGFTASCYDACAIIRFTSDWHGAYPASKTKRVGKSFPGYPFRQWVRGKMEILVLNGRYPNGISGDAVHNNFVPTILLCLNEEIIQSTAAPTLSFRRRH